MGFVRARLALAILRATALCIGGSLSAEIGLGMRCLLSLCFFFFSVEIKIMAVYYSCVCATMKIVLKINK